MWQSAEDGGPFLFTRALMSTSSIPTYLRDDWYRDWGSLEKFNRLVPQDMAPNADIEQGSVRVFGWSRVGPIRALP
jgi:arabinosyltransferase A